MFKFIYRCAVVILLMMTALLTGCRDKTPETSEIETGNTSAEALPILYIENEGRAFNHMQPYEIKMDSKAMYGSLLPAKNKEPFTVVIDGKLDDVTRVEYTLYDKSGKPAENGTVTADGISDTGAFSICLNNLKAEESQLELKLCFSEGIDTYYYTRVVAGDSISKALDYVMNIENACLKKDSNVDITLCMEWDLLTTKSSYYETDINASFDQVTWAGLNISDVVGDYYISVVDSSKTITSFMVNYEIYANDESNTKYFVKDFLRVRELDGDMFLLNFYRTTSQDFTKTEESFDSSNIYLGVGNGKEQYKTFDGGSQMFFVQNQCLYHFDVEANRITTVYSPNGMYKQAEVPVGNRNNIQLLDIRGDYFYFIVSGYLCDMTHRGASGISIMRYNLAKNEYEELFFQPVTYNYELVMQEADRLAYMNDEGSIFFVRNGEVCSYNAETNTLKDEVKNISLDTLVVSPGGEYIGWSKKQDGGEDILAVRNLNTGEELTIKPKSGTRIAPIGFVKNDFVYGISSIDEVESGVATDKQVLINEVCIVNEKGEIVKTYPQEGATRVLSGSTSDTVIVLNQGEKCPQGTVYEYKDQQQIVSGNKINDSNVTKKEIKLTDKGNIWVFNFDGELKGLPTFSTASFIEDTSIDKIKAEAYNISTSYKDKYFLYVKGGLAGTYKFMRDALNEAATLAGVVTDFDSNKLYYRIAKSKTAEALPQKSTLAAELLNHEDGVVAAWSEKEPNLNVLDITGFTPDDMLLFVSKGYPVLARYNADSFVWVIGYSENKIKCQSVTSDSIFEMSLTEAEEIFAKTGYEYYTCND